VGLSKPARAARRASRIVWLRFIGVSGVGAGTAAAWPELGKERA
jgi:hypothetical protein